MYLSTKITDPENCCYKLTLGTHFSGLPQFILVVPLSTEIVSFCFCSKRAYWRSGATLGITMLDVQKLLASTCSFLRPFELFYSCLLFMFLSCSVSFYHIFQD